jgi:hypothetical protein
MAFMRTKTRISAGGSLIRVLMAVACLGAVAVPSAAPAADLYDRKAERHPPKVRYHHRHDREYEYREVYHCRTGWWRVRSPGIEGMHAIRRPAWFSRCH